MSRTKSPDCLDCGAPRWKDYPRCQDCQQDRWRQKKSEDRHGKSAHADFLSDAPAGERILLLDEEHQQAWRVLAVEQHAVGRVLNPNTVGILEHQGYRVMRVMKGKAQ